MTTIITRVGKGAPLTNAEMDQNFQNLDENKLEHSVGTVVSASSIVFASNNTQFNVTALAVDASLDVPSGTPVDGWKVVLRIKDDGTPRALSYNAIYRAVNVTLPTTTIAGKLLYMGLMYNAGVTKWDMIAVAQEA
jgi:hypothetical protein